MRILTLTGVLSAVLALTVSTVNAQDYANIRTFLENSPEFRTSNPIVQRLAKSNQVQPFNWAIAASDAEREHLGRPVWLLASVIRALKDDPGKLAFVIAQGIAKNDVPARIDGRALVCTDKPVETMSALRGDPREYAVKSRAECESMADSIAVRYMVSAGYSPLEASAFLARVISARQNENGLPYLLQPPWVRDYVAMSPVNTQRLDHLRSFVNQFCKENSAHCQ